MWCLRMVRGDIQWNCIQLSFRYEIYREFMSLGHVRHLFHGWMCAIHWIWCKLCFFFLLPHINKAKKSLRASEWVREWVRYVCVFSLRVYWPSGSLITHPNGLNITKCSKPILWPVKSIFPLKAIHNRCVRVSQSFARAFRIFSPCFFSPKITDDTHGFASFHRSLRSAWNTQFDRMKEKTTHTHTQTQAILKNIWFLSRVSWKIKSRR